MRCPVRDAGSAAAIAGAGAAAIGTSSWAIAAAHGYEATPGMADRRALAAAGVARISHGPAPYLQAMDAVRTAARAVLGEAP